MSFKFEVMIQSLKVASQYIGTTLFMAITAIVLGVILGLGIALIRLYRIKGLSQFFQVAVTLLKGIPMVLIILALYLVASKQFDVWSESMNWSLRFMDFNMVWIAISALTLLATINSSEIFRGAFAAIKKGQFDAAKSMGMTDMQTIRRVLLPQAIPISLPMFSNLLISLVKASSLASMVSVVDVFAAAKITAQQNYRFLEAYVAVAVIYWGISLVIEKGAQILEQRMTRKLRRAIL
ncbi:amino acid ABC transporter permease [Trichococcus shcherbakoviae]|uniref:Amino acid ABC transporter permease n=1 Tax=Trichococcus shcherbakoviae subsp. psychrophilus TaxID=2585775 RepID=A0A5C5E9T6_9LACT|nr:amino acid ABC transporter permease [Trichococcus shcherbakoviae]TNV69734.1 amino acid ABC transporter permease [Trichococcus shcherbakoviae subsp. psychrophilus]